jgi:phage tail-like protein
MVTPQIQGVEIEFPRISLRRYLPAVFGEDPVSADFTDRFLAIFDTTLRSIESKLDRLAAYFDPLSAPVSEENSGQDFLDWLAGWVGISLEHGWSEDRRRHFLKQAGQIFKLRGTRDGLRRQLLLYFDMSSDSCCCPDDQPAERCDPLPLNCRIPEKKPCAWQPPEMILEHYQLRRWLFLGAGKLGDQAVLWGESIVNRSRLDDNAQTGVTQLKLTPDPQRDPFLVYAHRYTVFAPGCYGKDEANRRALESMLRRESPAHTRFDVRYVEPRFRIGVQSTVGLDAVIGRIPQGVTLHGEQPLGRDTVLTGGTGPGGPSFRIGRTSQIGDSTRLD